MSEENVEVVRKFFETYRRGDYDESLDCLAPDVVYKVAQEAPARAIWERWESAWEDLETTDRSEALEAAGLPASVND